MSAAIFSVIKAVLLEPLPYRAADRLVFVWEDLTHAGHPRAPLAGPELLDLRHRARAFDAFGGIWANTATLHGDGDPEQLRVGLVTANFFDVLGADAALGRTFRQPDEGAHETAGVLLSWAVFERRFGADPAAIGRRVEVNGSPARIIGVMPRRFRLLLPPDAAVPDDLNAWLLLPRSFSEWPRAQRFLRVVGRMKGHVELADAQEDIRAIGERIRRDFGGRGGLFAVPLHDDGVREVRPALLALFAGVGILLLVACVNVAGLLVTRAAARAHETAMRMALGAGRARLFRQCLAEGVVLALLGAVAAVAFAHAGLAALLAARPAALARIDAASIDWTVLAFAAAVALAWGLLFSLAPLGELLRTDLVAALQHGGRQSVHVPYRTRAALVTMQIALGVVLLVSAGLLVRGVLQLQRVDPGFVDEGVLTFRIAMAPPRFASPEKAAAFARALRHRLAAIPGVVAAGAISHLPYDELPNWAGPYRPEGRPDVEDGRRADSRAVMPGYFEAVGATLLDGRYFSDADTPASQGVAIVDERLAGRLWPGERAIGKRLLADPTTSGVADRLVTVVGVIRHMRHRRPTEEVNEQIYFPWGQSWRTPMAFAVRTNGPASTLAPSVLAAVRALDPQLPLADVRPLASYAEHARAARRFTAVLALAFAALATLLACLGVYGVTSYAVAIRRHEFGVRSALGAGRADVMRLVLREGVALAAAGSVLGLVGAAAAAQLIKAQLFGVTPADPVSYAVAVPLIAGAALAASWVPARRATRVSPLESLNGRQ
jgi:predicted permease